MFLLGFEKLESIVRFFSVNKIAKTPLSMNDHDYDQSQDLFFARTGSYLLSFCCHIPRTAVSTVI